MDKNKTVKISKYLSYVLRHRPDVAGLKLDEQGWVNIDELIEKTTKFKLNREIISIVVETNDKQRFAISDDGLRIKANQGHSIDIDLNLSPIEPPEILFHGTAERFMKAIEDKGLLKMNRHHVHLSESEAVAKSVGVRYGKVVLLTISSREMHNNGFKFYKSLNNVWLVDCVPIKYIQRNFME